MSLGTKITAISKNGKLKILLYFLNEMTHINGLWRGDIEIMAASAILKTDIFVASMMTLDVDSRKVSLVTFVGTYLGPQMRQTQPFISRTLPNHLNQ